MRAFIKSRFGPVLQRLFHWYYQKPRKFNYKGIGVIVEPGVFPPNYTISTKFFLNFISTLNLSGKTVLELGCGSGIISLYSAKKGGLVTSSDINKTALIALKRASDKNNLSVKPVYSDLFNDLDEVFDFVFINPPYYPKNPTNIKENAWFCGENFEYFEKLFPQLKFRMSHTKTYMILSEDCELEKIKTIGQKSDLKLINVYSKKIAKEKNYIFEIVLSK